MAAPIQLYVEHEESSEFVQNGIFQTLLEDRPGNRIAKLCVGPFTVLEVHYWSYEEYENDEGAAEAIASELQRRLK